MEGSLPGIIKDPVENTEAYKKAMKHIQPILDEEFKGRGLGACHAIWSRKKELLFQQYGIFWQSPAELNKNVIFD